MPSNRQVQRTISAGEFKNRCLALMDEVNENGMEIVITKHGKPVSKFVAAENPTPEIWGRYRDQVRIVADILDPAVPEEEWEVFSNPVGRADKIRGNARSEAVNQTARMLSTSFVALGYCVSSRRNLDNHTISVPSSVSARIFATLQRETRKREPHAPAKPNPRRTVGPRTPSPHDLLLMS